MRCIQLNLPSAVPSHSMAAQRVAELKALLAAAELSAAAEAGAPLRPPVPPVPSHAVALPSMTSWGGPSKGDALAPGKNIIKALLCDDASSVTTVPMTVDGGAESYMDDDQDVDMLGSVASKAAKNKAQRARAKARAAGSGDAGNSTDARGVGNVPPAAAIPDPTPKPVAAASVIFHQAPSRAAGEGEGDGKTIAQGKSTEIKGTPEPTPGQTFPCSGGCKLFWRPGDVVLQAVGDWQGTIPGLCPGCSGLGDSHKGAARASWRKREIAKGKEARLVRSCSWKALLADLDERHPGESRAAYRERAKVAWVMHAALIAVSFDHATPKQQGLVLKAVREFASTANLEATVPGYLAPIDPMSEDFFMEDKVLCQINN